jgi:hypothetical protein
MSLVDKRRPLDQAFIDGMRERFEVASWIDKIKNHIIDPKANPLQRTQIDCAKLLLAKVIPDLKSVEHSGEVTRRKDLTDAELDARLAELLRQREPVRTIQ